MTIKSSFFNSVSGDRIYDASDFASYFASFIGNGVFPNPSNNLQVLAVNGNVLKVSVSVGKGFINGYYAENDAPLELQLSSADGNLSRIDRVVLALNTTSRAISAYVKTGSLNSNPVAPSIVRNGPIYELALADVSINPNTTSIGQANITDLRPNNDVCGFVTSVVNQVDTSTLFLQYQQAFEDYSDEQEQNFADFLARIEAQLDGNTAGNLQNQIDTKANINSPILTGSPQAPTPPAGNVSTVIATTAFVDRALNTRLQTVTTANTQQTWVRLGTLSNAQTTTASKLSLIVEGLGSFGDAEYDSAFIHFTNYGTPVLKVRFLYSELLKEATKRTVFGYSLSGNNMQLWMKIQNRNQNLSFLKLGVENGLIDGVTRVTVEPVGIVYITPESYTTNQTVGELSALQTTNKTNIVGSINELFTSVSNGKNSIAAAVTSKGVPSQGSDTFAQLANNISAIESGSRVASGVGTVSSNAVFFTRTLPTATSVERLYLTVSGLSFFPARIVITAPQEVFNTDYANTVRDPLRRIIMSGNSSTNQYEVISQQGNAVVSGSGFTLPMPFLATPGQSVRWTAYSQ